MAVNDERGRVQQSSIVVQKRRPLTVRICLLHWQAKAILGNPKSERLPNIDIKGSLTFNGKPRIKMLAKNLVLNYLNSHMIKTLNWPSIKYLHLQVCRDLLNHVHKRDRERRGHFLRVDNLKTRIFGEKRLIELSDRGSHTA